jgi:hypothetical protein
LFEKARRCPSSLFCLRLSEGSRPQAAQGL